MNAVEVRVARLARAFRSFMFGGRRLDRSISRSATLDFGFDHPLHYEQISLLCLLEGGPLRQVQVARLLDVAPCHARASLLSLKKLGLVRLDVERGKKMVASLSPLGRKIAKRAQVDAGAALHNLLTRLKVGPRFVDDLEKVASEFHQKEICLGVSEERLGRANRVSQAEPDYS